MKKGFILCVVLMGCLAVTVPAVSAMDSMAPGGCCGSNSAAMECSSMNHCDHGACICGSVPDHSGVSCACCDMCATDGCAAGMVTAMIDIQPGNLNVKSSARLITVYIEPEDPENLLSAHNIDAGSIYLKKADDTMIRIDGEKLFTSGQSEYGDYDENGISDLMVKFDRQDLIEFLTANEFGNGEVTISLSGKLYDGTKFKGAQKITINGQK